MSIELLLKAGIMYVNIDRLVSYKSRHNDSMHLQNNTVITIHFHCAFYTCAKGLCMSCIV